MNILILSNKPPYPPKDGGAIAILNLAKGMASLGNNVHILAMNTSKHPVSELDTPNIPNLTISLVPVNTEIKFSHLIFNLFCSQKPYNIVRFESEPYRTELKNILERSNFDIIQFEGPYLWYCFPLIKKLSNGKVTLRSHNIEHEIWNRNASNEKNFFKHLYLNILAKRIRKFELKVLNAYDYLLPITSRDGNIFQDLGNTKPSIVIPVGINKPDFIAVQQHIQKTACYIGALDWIPNYEAVQWLIEKVWPLVIKNEPTAILHIAGRNAPNWLSAKITVSNVMYHGEVPNAHKFMLQNGVMLVPLFSGSGMRVKIIEGMALGKVIITTPIGAEGINVTHNENIFIANNEVEFANYILDVFNNLEISKNISMKAQRFALENYDNIAISEKLMAFYKNQN